MGQDCQRGAGDALTALSARSERAAGPALVRRRCGREYWVGGDGSRVGLSVGKEKSAAGWASSWVGLLLALLKYQFYPLFILDNGMN